MPAYPFNFPTSDTQFEPIPLSKVAPWAVLGGLVLLLTLYVVRAEEGTVSSIFENHADEFVHNGTTST